MAGAALVMPWRKLSSEGSKATIDELNIVASISIDENVDIGGTDDDETDRGKLVSA